MAIELPPWLTRQYDYASGIRQTGQQIAENLLRRKQLETQAIHAAAQAEQARALEGWRIAQTQALQEKAMRDKEAQLEERARIEAFQRAVAKGENRQRAADRLLLGTSVYDQIRKNEEATKTPTAFDQREGAAQRLLKLLDERKQEEKRQQLEITARDNPIRRLKELNKEEVKIPESMNIQEEFLRVQAGIPKPKAKVADQIDEKTKEELRILRTEKAKLEKKKISLTEDEKEALAIINNRIVEITGAPGLLNPVPEVDVQIQEMQMPSSKKPYLERKKVQPALPGRAQ